MLQDTFLGYNMIYGTKKMESPKRAQYAFQGFRTLETDGAQRLVGVALSWSGLDNSHNRS